MALRAKKPTVIQKRLKCLLYGKAGSGKTYASIQFPKPYLIDTERGAENDEYRSLLEKQEGVIFQSTDFDNVLNEVKSLLTEKHDYKTLIIDPLTTIYTKMLDDEAEKIARNSKDKDATGTEFGRHKRVPDMKMKQLLNLLLRLDMNVVITSHAKTHWVMNGREFADGGQTFDCYNKLDYLFDLCLYIDKRAKKHFAKVTKSRIAGFPIDESFEFSYEELSSRYGDELLQRAANPIDLATVDQIEKLTHLINVTVPAETKENLVSKWLNSANVADFTEMTSAQVDKCIIYLEDRINVKAS